MKYLIGIGNYSMFDDSVGLRMMEYIEENDLDKGFQAVDLSGNCLNLISYFKEETEKIVVVDTLKEGLEPGDYKFFSPEDVKTKKELANISTHEGDVMKILELAVQMGYKLPPIRFMGIGPEEIKNEMGLSNTLQEKMPEFVKAAIEELL